MNIPLFRLIGTTLAALAFAVCFNGCASKPDLCCVDAPATASAAKPASIPDSGELFDGKTLNGWMQTDFSGRGTITVTNGEIRAGMGHMTGITLTSTNGLPHMNYELSLDAMRTEGGDFFCGLTFPVGNDPCSFIVGGWGGGVVGLSSIDSEDASQNETSSSQTFVSDHWYHLRVRVETGKIQAWIDDNRVVNLETEGKRIGVRLEMDSSTPLGLATWSTAAAWKNIRIKKL